MAKATQPAASAAPVWTVIKSSKAPKISARASGLLHYDVGKMMKVVTPFALPPTTRAACSASTGYRSMTSWHYWTSSRCPIQIGGAQGAVCSRQCQ